MKRKVTRNKPNPALSDGSENSERSLTKDEFLKVLNKATQRVPKASHKPEKKGTSG